MRAAAIVIGVLASAGWALSALIYAAWMHIEGLADASKILAGLAFGAIGIGCLGVGLRRALRSGVGSATLLLTVAAVAFVAWLAIVPG